jgi:hypothetical protein
LVYAASSKKIIMTKAPRSSSSSGQDKAITVAPEMSPHKVKRKSGAVSESDKDILKSKKPKVEQVDELAPPVKKRRAPSGKGKGNVGGSGKEAASALKETAKKEKDAAKQEPEITSQGSIPPQRAQRKSNIYRLVMLLYSVLKLQMRLSIRACYDIVDEIGLHILLELWFCLVKVVTTLNI